LNKAVENISANLIGKEITDVMVMVEALRRKYRQSLPGLIWKSISAVENSLWDVLSKIEEKPIAHYFNRSIDAGQVNKYSAYWSHCPTTRIRASEHINSPAVTDHDDLKTLGLEISKTGFTAIKTNLVSLDPTPRIYMPGFNPKLNFTPEKIPLNYNIELSDILNSISTCNLELEFILDANFNLNLTEFQKIQDVLLEKNIKWIEIDFDDFDLYSKILDVAKIPICSGENVLGLWNYIHLLNDPRIEIVSIDLLWNGLCESLRIAERAIAAGKKIAVHNYYGGLATSMACLFLSMLPSSSLELIEFDYDDVPWRDEIITNPVMFDHGSLLYQTNLGWNNNVALDKAEYYLA
jgi:galactonate dehydratase